MSDAKDTMKNIAMQAWQKHMSIQEKMCIDEMVRIIDEQIKSGDFVQHICRTNNSFALTYIPYRDKMRLQNQIVQLQKQNELLQEVNSLLRECVEFYGDKKSWYNSLSEVHATTVITWSDVDRKSGGKKARETLEKIKTLSNETEEMKNE